MSSVSKPLQHQVHLLLELMAMDAVALAGPQHNLRESEGGAIELATKRDGALVAGLASKAGGGHAWLHPAIFADIAPPMSLAALVDFRFRGTNRSAGHVVALSEVWGTFGGTPALGE